MSCLVGTNVFIFLFHFFFVCVHQHWDDALECKRTWWYFDIRNNKHEQQMLTKSFNGTKHSVLWNISFSTLRFFLLALLFYFHFFCFFFYFFKENTKNVIWPHSCEFIVLDAQEWDKEEHEERSKQTEKPLALNFLCIITVEVCFYFLCRFFFAFLHFHFHSNFFSRLLLFLSLFLYLSDDNVDAFTRFSDAKFITSTKLRPIKFFSYSKKKISEEKDEHLRWFPFHSFK